MSKRFFRILVNSFLLALLALGLATPALAFDGREGDNVVIDASEVINDDLYVGAENFTLEGTVKGDLVVAGAVITINGTVEGDLIAAGQAIIINGVIGDDARVAAGASWLAKMPALAAILYLLVAASKCAKAALLGMTLCSLADKRS